MSKPEDDMSLEEARSILFGIESPYDGEELSDRELSECANALDLGDDPPEEFDFEEAVRLGRGEEGETDL